MQSTTEQHMYGYPTCAVHKLTNITLSLWVFAASQLMYDRSLQEWYFLQYAGYSGLTVEKNCA